MNNAELEKYPITPYLDEICGTLKNSSSRFLILTAETAAGKSTILPLSLLKNFSGNIIMTEPRRLAVLSVANRVSDLLGEKCGQTVGYKIHLENSRSPSTRLDLVTEAILVRQLQEDPALQNYSVVVLDEFHERSINTDLALAFIKEAMQLRNDLYVIIMSATIDVQKLQTYLGEQTPVLQIPGRQFPVTLEYQSEKTVEQAVLSELKNPQNENGNILVFLPSISDIKKTYNNLQPEIPSTYNLSILHSSVSLDEQKKVLEISDHNIILSSSIAETSLTVPGVTCVIDSGLSRINRMNVATGMENLSTEIESEFSATQRAGRAGRLQEGKCVRLWSKASPRNKNIPCEILRADLCNLVLDCAERGVYKSEQIDWFEAPGEGSWEGSVKLLKMLEMLDKRGQITKKGKAALKLGVHPRLGSVALESGDLNLVLKYSSFAQASKETQKRFISDLQNRISKSEYKSKNLAFNSVLFGFPDRIAKRISEFGVKPAEYQFAVGRKAKLKNDIKTPEWIVAPEVFSGDREGIIFDFEEISEKEVNDWLLNKTQTKTKSIFENGKIQKFEIVCYGEIVLNSKKVAAYEGDLAEAWCNEVIQKGTDCLPKDARINGFLERAEFWFQEKDLHGMTLEEYLKEKVNEWLPPFITGNKLNSENIYNALYWFLNGAEIEKEVPFQITLENGNK